MQTSLNVLQDNSWVMLSANERITKIVKSLKSFSRLDAPIFQKADLHEGLDSTLDLLEHEFKEDISIKTEYGKLPEITCFPSELNQVFMHLLTNAAQSISGKGKITIRTYLADNKIHIQITDSGIGMAPEQITHLFEPDFTKKGSRVKAGMGLFICNNIVRKHGGQILVESQVDEGSTFVIHLPVDLEESS